MKIHEYQAKELLKKGGVAVPEGGVAFSGEEAQRIADQIGGEKVVIKAQIHAGGRGKGGGVRVVPRAQAGKTAAEMIGMTLVTHQTGPEGKLVRKVLVEQALEIARELYVGIVLDRARSALVFMASSEGGVEIEEVAAESPEKILKEYIDRGLGLQPFQARKLAFGLGLRGEQLKNAVRVFTALAQAYLTYDCSLAEINPLVVTSDGRVLALDAKINLDDNALYRHPDLAALRDVEEEEPLEAEAAKYDLNYIRLDGTVGCMVNGAGLAMATMDIIKLAGAEPANFLDVGGGASAETVENGFRILLSDKNVRAVLVNIFGGIVRCDRVARGVIEAARKVDLKVPLVVRLEGTNAKEAAELLATSGLNFAVATTFAGAAQKVVEVMRN
ncbi:MAG: ADP-forming succinate--CoA ligase subunit beta [bacterium]|jgi:succinyl-CoA synthetase beta subunit|nr:ADP-forming succinate--CoA ligase subunit beta [candidate division KSB1 bacterium]MDH7561323.1 ADP-forming succinate--CoA ligase subunit beta [bacterium]